MTWLAPVHSRGGAFSLVFWSLLRLALICVVAVVALFSLSGCAARVVTHFGPTLDSPYVTHVCVHQPKVPENQRFWGVTDSGKLVLEDWELALYQEHGRSIFYFDPEAPPESAGRLPIPYNKLECPERILSKAPILPRKPAAVAKKPEEEKKNETKEPEAKTSNAEAKPPPPQPSATPPRRTEEHRPRRQEPPRVASKGCEGFSESGQKRLPRSKGTRTRTCTSTRTLKPPSVREEPEQEAANPPREPSRVALALPEPKLTGRKENAEQPFGDWPVDEPDTSGLTPDRAMECLENLCHSRHPNFIKERSGKKGAEQKGYAKVGEGGGGNAPSTGTRTTVKTRKSPLSGSNNGVPKEGAKLGGKAPSTGNGNGGKASPPKPQRGRDSAANPASTASPATSAPKPAAKDPTTPSATSPSSDAANGTPRVPSKTLRKQWEADTGQPWPKDPKTGRNQDVAHKKPLADGGTNGTDNIEPVPHSEHMRQHSQAGDFKR